jgi:excisionase family DNA binding protein
VEGQKTIHSVTPGFLSLDHAAQYVDVSVKTIKQWIDSGLPTYQARPRSKVLIRSGDIEEFLTRQKVVQPELNELVNEVMKDLLR